MIFVEVVVTDPSDFAGDLAVRGLVRHHRYRVLEIESASVPNALAALALHVRDVTGVTPHVYVRLDRGQPGVAPAALPGLRGG